MVQLKGISQILKTSKFNFEVSVDHVLTCTYNADKGSFKIALPIDGPNIVDADRKYLSEIIELFDKHSNKLTGTFPPSCFELIKGQAPKVQKAYKITKNVVYIDKAKRTKIVGDIDLSNPDTLKAYEIECDLIPDIQLISHPKFGVGASMIYNGHIIGANAMPKFNSNDKIMNFIDTVLEIGMDKVFELAKNVIDKKEAAGQDDEDKEHIKACKEIKNLLIADETIFDSWGVESLTYSKDADGHPMVEMMVNGFLHVGKVQVSAIPEKGYKVVILDGEKIVHGFCELKAETVADRIDSLIEYAGDHDQYLDLCRQFYGLSQAMELETEQALKVA